DDDEGANTDNIATEVAAALKMLGTNGLPAIDPGRVAMVGHSWGAVLVFDYAASAAARGLPVPGAILSAAPGGPATAPSCPGADLSAIPATTQVALVSEANDGFVPVSTANDINDRLVAVPPDHRVHLMLVSDYHGKPLLDAYHGQAATDPDPEM